jgi:transcriptional regulator with AAA-type ATPase domain
LRRFPATALVGRGREMEAVRAALDAAAARGGTAFAVVGEPGIGKSRLAAEAIELASRGDHARLVGRAVPSGSPVPYRPLCRGAPA